MGEDQPSDGAAADAVELRVETNNEEDDSEELDGKVAWLKDNIQPAHQVEKYMKETFQRRRKWIKSETAKSVEDILLEYPRLLNPNMVCLVLHITFCFGTVLQINLTIGNYKFMNGAWMIQCPLLIIYISVIVVVHECMN